MRYASVPIAVPVIIPIVTVPMTVPMPSLPLVPAIFVRVVVVVVAVVAIVIGPVLLASRIYVNSESVASVAKTGKQRFVEISENLAQILATRINQGKLVPSINIDRAATAAADKAGFKWE